MQEIRCPKCNRLLGKVLGSYWLYCRQCKRDVAGNTELYKTGGAGDYIPQLIKVTNVSTTSGAHSHAEVVDDYYSMR